MYLGCGWSFYTPYSMLLKTLILDSVNIQEVKANNEIKRENDEGFF